MYEVMVSREFSAANQLKGYEYEGRADKLHGHNFNVQVFAQSKTLDEANVAVHREHLLNTLNELLDQWDHDSLIDYPEFKGLPTSVENTTRYVYQWMKQRFPEVSKVTIDETSSQSAVYYE